MAIGHFWVVVLIGIRISSIKAYDPNMVELSIPNIAPMTPFPAQSCRRLEKAPEDREFRIAWLAPEKEYHGFSAATSVGGVKLALAMIDSQKLFPGWKVRAKWYDSNCDSKDSMAAAVKAVEEYDPDVFIGPPCSTGLLGVAQLAAIWNLPVFSWVSDLLDFKDNNKYSTLVRLSPPLFAISENVRLAGLYFGWKTYAVIYDKRAPYKAVALAIQDLADKKKYNIRSSNYVTNETSRSDIEQMLNQIKKFSRVIIFVVPWESLRDYLLIAHSLGMANGEYAFFCIHGELFTWDVMDRKVMSDWGWRRNDSNDEKAREIFESVIHMINDPVVRSYWETFKKVAVNASNVTLAAWELPTATAVMPDAYAPFLYDAFLTWAFAVTATLKDNGNPRDGRLIYGKVRDAAAGIDFSITGHIVFQYPDLDRMLNYQTLDMYENGSFYRLMQFNFKKNKKMKVDTDDNESLERGGRWPTHDGKPPPDTPVCGFDGENCKTNDNSSYKGIIIGASLSASVVLILAVAVHMMLRRYRRQMTLQRMLWRVRLEEIDFVPWLTGSIRNSFKNLSRRKPSTKTMKRTQCKGKPGEVKRFSSCDMTNKGYRNSSPDVQCKLIDPDAMFGSVAFVRGNLASVKRLQKTNLNLSKGILLELNQLIEMKHQNICAFMGACLEMNRAMLFWEYCAKGSLQDVIWNQNIKLDQMFMFALSHDVAKGLEYIHKSAIHYHGNLRSTNCVVDSRWTCKVTDFGLHEIREAEKQHAAPEKEDIDYDKLLWTSPEVLRESAKVLDMQKVDIYALGVILKEVFTRSGPYTEYPFLMAHEIIEKIREPIKGGKPFRPMVSLKLRQQTEVTSLIEDCWVEEPSSRPSATRVLKTLNKNNPQNLSMIDNMILMLEKYANHLEDLVAERTSELDAEKAKTENLLYRMLPQTVAEELKLGRPIKAEQFDEVTLYFSDIVGFTSICASSTPIQVVNLLNSLYTLFDAIITNYDVYKVETIGDAYMIASGLPNRNGKKHVQQVADCSLDILASVSTFCIPHQPDKKVRIRVGIHSGPVVAGVVGLAMPRYCLFGDTVNTASRMESTGSPLRIHLSSQSKIALDAYAGYHLHCRGEIPVKGKGLMTTYFLCGRDGFQKDLPKWDDETPVGNEKERLDMRVSVTSINSMASLISSVPTTSPGTSSDKLSLQFQRSRTPSTVSEVVPEILDDRYKSKQTSILEVTCL